MIDLTPGYFTIASMTPIVPAGSQGFHAPIGPLHNRFRTSQSFVNLAIDFDRYPAFKEILINRFTFSTHQWLWANALLSLRVNWQDQFAVCFFCSTFATSSLLTQVSYRFRYLELCRMRHPTTDKNFTSFFKQVFDDTDQILNRYEWDWANSFDGNLASRRKPATAFSSPMRWSTRCARWCTE